MQRPRLLVSGLVVLVVVLGLAGLPGCAAADDSPLSAKQWRRQANSICKQSSNLLADAADRAFGTNKPDDQPSLAQVTEYAGLAQPIVQDQIASIDALDEPAKLRPKVKKLLEAARTDLARFVADPSIGLETNPFTETMLQAEKLRLKSC
ncbi:MAG: hypothetical protein WEC34_12135 [Acidimicrobiia bacterium]